MKLTQKIWNILLSLNSFDLYHYVCMQNNALVISFYVLAQKQHVI